MYKTLERTTQGSVYPASISHLDNEGLKRRREDCIVNQKKVLEDFETLVASLWDSLRFMKTQGFYSEHSFQLSGTQHLEQALADVLLRKKAKEFELEQYEAEHKKASGNE